MRALHRFISQVSSPTPLKPPLFISLTKTFSSSTSDDNSPGKDWSASFGGDDSNKFVWDASLSSSSSTGQSAQYFDGDKVGQQTGAESTQEPGSGTTARAGYKLGGFDSTQVLNEEQLLMSKLEDANRQAKAYADSWGRRLKETNMLMKQVKEPGVRGLFLKDSEKAEMYKKHKQNPEVYTVEKLAKEYRIMRQRVHAILFLKEEEEEEKKKKLGHKLEDSVESLIDAFPEFYKYHDKEFHVASLHYKPDFAVMPEGWDGTTRDPDEVHYEISKKEDEMLYQEFLQRFNFNKMKLKGQVQCHRYSRRRPSEGWKFTIEKLGKRDKRGDGGGVKFVSLADGSSRPLNETEKMFLKRETPRRRRKILP